MFKLSDAIRKGQVKIVEQFHNDSPTGHMCIAKEHRPLVIDAIRKEMLNPQHTMEKFLQEFGPDALIKNDGLLQEFATKGDFPASVVPDILKKFQNLPTFDNGWQMIFDEIDFRSSRRNSFRLVDVDDSLQFNRIYAPGEKAKIYQMNGSQVTVNFNQYAGGLGWSRLLIDDEEYWTIDNTTNSFRNVYFEFIASLHYTLIETTTNLTAWALHPDGVATGTVGYRAGRDAETINQAAIAILNAVDGKGYNNATPTWANFVILAPFELRKRIREAMSYRLQPFVESEPRMDFSFTLVTTAMLSATDVYYVILPKNKIISANRQDLTIFDSFDMLSYTDTMVGWFRRGLTIADTDQLEKCSTAGPAED